MNNFVSYVLKARNEKPLWNCDHNGAGVSGMFLRSPSAIKEATCKD
jgi:hypothetical protein